MIEPTAACNLTDVKIGLCISEEHVISCKFYPCRTQAIERTVKLVTESSSCACSHLARKGIIVSTLALEKCIPASKSKKHFVPVEYHYFLVILFFID